MHRAFGYMLALVGLLAPATAASAAELALIIGISDYANFQKLLKAKADAESAGNIFSKLGFEVELVAPDQTGSLEIRARIGRFVARIREGDIVALVFAGHGVQVADTNYLVPSDAAALTEGEEVIVRQSINLGQEIRSIGERNPQFALYVMDACRSNPAGVPGRGVGGGAAALRGRNP